MAAPGPPWRPIPSRDVAKILGVSLQSLANWRVRGTGPPPEPMQKGLGNRIYYRPDKIMAWLTGEPWWQFTAKWLGEQGLGVNEVSEATVLDRIEVLDRLRVLE